MHLLLYLTDSRMNCLVRCVVSCQLRCLDFENPAEAAVPYLQLLPPLLRALDGVCSVDALTLGSAAYALSKLQLAENASVAAQQHLGASYVQTVLIDFLRPTHKSEGKQSAKRTRSPTSLAESCARWPCSLDQHGPFYWAASVESLEDAVEFNASFQKAADACHNIYFLSVEQLHSILLLAVPIIKHFPTILRRTTNTQSNKQAELRLTVQTKHIMV
eukprot:6272640-Amphidinium_carterae.1